MLCLRFFLLQTALCFTSTETDYWLVNQQNVLDLVVVFMALTDCCRMSFADILTYLY